MSASSPLGLPSRGPTTTALPAEISRTLRRGSSAASAGQGDCWRCCRPGSWPPWRLFPGPGDPDPAAHAAGRSRSLGDWDCRRRGTARSTNWLVLAGVPAYRRPARRSGLRTPRANQHCSRTPCGHVARPTHRRSTPRCDLQRGDDHTDAPSGSKAPSPRRRCRRRTGVRRGPRPLAAKSAI